MYHSPCIDGIYSLMNLVMVLKSKITYENWTVDKIIQRIEEYLAKILRGEQETYEAQTTNLPNVQKSDFFKSTISDQIVYIPIQFGIVKNEAYNLVVSKQGNYNYKDSIIVSIYFIKLRFYLIISVDVLMHCYNCLPCSNT